MFFATHSEYIIDAALRDKENILIIVLSDHNGKIEKYYINNFSVLPETTYAEINYFAFHMPTRDYFMQLYGYLQSIKSIGKIKDMDDFIFNNCENFDKDFYYKNCKYNNTEYFTLPTYIRNSISHPNQNNKFDNTELNRGIIILIRILGNLKKQN